MKKILSLLAISLIAFTSCHGDDDLRPYDPDAFNPATDVVLLTKTIEHYSDNTSLTTVYAYDGNRLLTTTDSDGYHVKFSYTGNLITKIEYFTAANTLDQKDTFSYNAQGQLITFVTVDPGSNLGSKEIYTYNTNGTVSINHYTGDGNIQATADGTGTITISNGEVSQIVTDYSPGFTYSYDIWNNPGKNVLGFNKLLFYGAEATGSVFHNLLAETTDGVPSALFTYDYNEGHYPVSDTQDFDGDITTTEYFYNNSALPAN